MSGDKSCHAVRWATSWLMLHIKSTLPCASKHHSSLVSPLSPTTCLQGLSISSPAILPAKLLLSKSPFLFSSLTFYHSDILSVLHSLHILSSISLWEIKAVFLFPPAYLAARQIAPLVSKWPQQKDNDKRAVSQLSFPLSAPTSHITVIDCSISGSAIVPRDTTESCQEL